MLGNRASGERGVASALLAVCILRAALFAVAIAPASLAHDELLSVTKYESRGPLHALTTYEEPNNHILFNALNAIVSGARRPISARVRAISMASVALLLGALVVFLWRRALYLESALLVAVFAGNPIVLSLWFSVRGYGLQALFAATASLAFVSWAESGRLRPLVVLSLSCVLGIWTVPTFLLFAAPLLLVGFVARPGRKAALAALGAGAMTAAVHLPVLRAMRVALSTYGEAWGRDFASPSAVAVLFKLTLIPGLGSRIPDGIAFVILIGLMGAASAGAARRFDACRPYVALAAAVGAFLAACLVLKTPVLRATGFIAIPLGLSLIVPIGQLARSAAAPLAGRVVGALSAGCVLAVAVGGPWPGRFDPDEHWKEVAGAVESTLPDGTAVFGSYGRLIHEERWTDFLNAYMRSPERFPAARAFDRDAFAGGRLVVHERPYRETEPLAASMLPQDAVRIRFRQTYVGYQALWLVPPPDSGIASLREASGREIPGGVVWGARCRCEITVAPGEAARSLVLSWDRALERAPTVVADGGAPEAGEQREATTLVRLAGSRGRPRRLVVEGAGPEARLVRAWVYPVAWPRR